MIPITQALADPKLLGAALGPTASWSNWMAVLKATFGLELSRQERRAFASIAGSRKPPKQKVRELWCVVGRRGGKSRAAAAVSTYIACFLDHSSHLVPGETGYVLTLSPTLAQAQLVQSYCLAFLESSPILAQQIISSNATEIKLKGNIVISTHACSFRSVRGRTLLAVVMDETAYFRDETSAVPDVECYRAVTPALTTTGGMLIGISSPYRRQGLLFQKHRDYFGKDDDEVLVVQGSTELFNPTIDRKLIAKQRKEDPIAAASEWDAEFRTDLSQFLDDATIDAAVDASRPLELPPREDKNYSCFVDSSAGRHDAFTMCIAHEDDGKFIADVVRGKQAPFDPETTATEYAALARSYRIGTVVGDNYAGEWTAAAFRKHGLDYQRSRLNKSAIYLESLNAWMQGLVSIPNQETLIRELRLLERRVTRSGKDSVDHGLSGTDDYANALCGGIHLVMGFGFEPVVSLCAPLFWDRSTGEFQGTVPCWLNNDKPLKVDLTSEMGGPLTRALR